MNISSGSRVLLMLLCALPQIAAAETAQVLRDVELKKEPYADAESLTTLSANSPVQITQRQGAWLQVQTGEHQGWLRLLAVRGTAAAKTGGAGGLNQAINVARSGSSGTSVATGVRGLSKEEIQAAQPNTAELERMQRYAQSDEQARAFAGQAPALAAVELRYLNEAGEPQ